MAEYAIPEWVFDRIERLKRAHDLIDLQYALGDLGVEVSDLIRVESQRAKVEGMEAEVERLEARDRWRSLRPEMQDALVRSEFDDLPVTSDAPEADSPA